MKKNLKVLVSMICLVLAMVTSVTYVGAAQIGGGETAEPLWDNTSMIQAGIVNVDGTGYVDALCMGDFDATCVKIDVYLFRQLDRRWVYMTQRHVTNYKFAASVNFPFEFAEGATYRADFTFTVTKNGIDEIIYRTEYKTF